MPSAFKVKLNNALLAEANRCQSQVSITGVRCQSQANRCQSQVPESTNKPHRGEIILEMDMNEVIDQVVGSHQSREAVAVRPAFTHFNRTLRLCALLRTPISTTNIVSCDSTFAFFVLAFHWVNVFKFCAVYTQLQSDSFGPKFFTLIIVHILTLQTASCATMFVFPFSRTFPKLLKRWSTYKKLYGGLSVYYIKRVIIMSVVFVWTLAASTYTLFCTVGVFYGRNVKSLDLMHRSILIPFYQEGDVPIYLYALAVCLFHMYIFVAAAQLFSLSVLCYFLKREFKDITVVLEADIKRKDDHLLNIEHYRQRHNAVAALVSTLDDMVSGYLAVEYGTDIPVLIFTVYCFIYSGDFTDSAQSIMTLMAVPSISVMAWLGICTGCSAMIHTAVSIHPIKHTFNYKC